MQYRQQDAVHEEQQYTQGMDIMTNDTLAKLDQAELFKLALHATGSGDSGAAIAYLKEAVERPDATAMAHYLLGAEYAQIGMFDRATDHMEAAIALAPALAIARLQLGLLWLGANQLERGVEVLTVLQELSEHDPLRHFGSGLLQLAQGDAAAARQSLRSGMALNTANAALNADMQRIVEKIEQSGAVPAELEAEAEGGQHVLLSAYTGHHGQ